MYDQISRLTALFAVVAALLNSGFHFHQGNLPATLYFMVAAILLTLLTYLNVRKQMI